MSAQTPAGGSEPSVVLPPAGLPPVTLAELVERTAADDEWGWDECIYCGEPTTHRGLTVLPNGQIKRIGWCDQPTCDTDRTMTDYLEVNQ